MILKLIQAITEFIEARSEQLREETATLQLGTYARGLADGRQDAIEAMGLEVVYLGEDDDED